MKLSGGSPVAWYGANSAALSYCPSPCASTERNCPKTGTVTGGGSWAAAAAGPAAATSPAATSAIAAHLLWDLGTSSTGGAIINRLSPACGSARTLIALSSAPPTVAANVPPEGGQSMRARLLVAAAAAAAAVGIGLALFHETALRAVHGRTSSWS